MASSTEGQKATRSESYEDAVQALNTLQSNAETLAKIASTRDSRRHLNIPSMLHYLRRCGIELEELKNLSVIHISGTKGKGSTSAFCESILHHHGYKTGMFSSPHLVTVNERFRLNRRPVAKDVFSKYFWEVYNKLDATKDTDTETDIKPMPNYFSFLTVMAFNMFLREKIDVAIMEVGIGGEYDCTNVFPSPVVCGVTSLGLDHTTVLGDTIDKIAWQKAGIFKPNVPAVTVQQPQSAMDVLLSRAKEKGASVYLAPPLDDYNTEGEAIQLGIAGSMQKHNATLALQLCTIWMHNQDKDLSRRKWLCDQSGLARGENIPVLDTFQLSNQMKQGVGTCYWPGRNHVLRRKGVTYYLDGAHTLESIQQCADWFRQESTKEAAQHKGRTCKVLVFNATKDRNSHLLLSQLKPVGFEAAVFCPNLAFSGNITNTPDQVNRTVTKERQLNFSLANKEIWDNIIKTTTDPLKSSPKDEHDMPSTQSNPSNAADTKIYPLDLNSNNCNSNSAKTVEPDSHAFPCIMQALHWASVGRDPVLSLVEDSDVPSLFESLKSCGHIQVLVTGSLHLVGGALGLLNPELW